MNRPVSPPLSAQGATSATLPLRVCTVCDGVDAVMRLASWLAHLPSNAERVDLELSDAIHWLTNQNGEIFDMLVIAPNAARSDATPRLVRAVLTEMQRRAVMQIVLLPAGTRLSLPDMPHVHLLTGPPFPSPSMLSRRPEVALQPAAMPEVAPPASGLAGRLGNWFPMLRKGGTDAERVAAGPERKGPVRVIAVQPLCGGAGATTMAITLAQELAEADPKLSICLMDLDLQFGNVSGYLNLPAEARVMETYRDPRAVDGDMFQQGLRRLRPNLRVFPAPAEILPVDALSGSDLQYLLGLAKDASDLVILDLPVTVTDWSEAVYLTADRIYMVGRLDVRSVSNLRRLRALVEPRVLPAEKLSPVLNFRPARAPRDWSARVGSYERGMALPVHLQLPDGGAAVGTACDSGQPLMEADPGNPYRLAMRNYAQDFAALVPRSQRLLGDQG